MKLSAFAINNYQFTLILILLLVLSGVVSFLTMPRSEDPQVTPNGTSVVVLYPGAGPADMEQLVVDPIEEKINEMDDIKRINSSARDGVAVIAVEFHADVDMDQSYSEILQKVNSIRSDLPEDIMNLSVHRWNMSDFVITLQLALLSETAAYHELNEEAERLEKRLEKIFGVKHVRIWAVPQQEVRISLDLDRLAQRRISLNQVIQSVQSANFNIPGGHVDVGDRRFNIRTSGSFEELEEIRNIIVFAYGEKVVFLKDIAGIQMTDSDVIYKARVNGRRAVFVTINQKEGTNVFTVMGQVKEEIRAFEEDLPGHMELFTVFDQSGSVRTRLNIFFSNLLQGLILVGLVVFLAVGMRASVIVMLAIPVSIFIALGFVDLSGFGLQQMSIAGLVIALGLLVDNAIVVTENISRFIGLGYERKEAAIKATGQIGWAIISSTVTTILAFLPVAMMGYTSGEYIRSMPYTVIFTLSASLFIALTLTPFLSSRLLTVRATQKPSLVKRALNRLIDRGYRPALSFALRRPLPVLGLTLAAFLISLFLFQFVGVSFFPKAEKAQLVINLDTPKGSGLDTTDRIVRQVENVLEGHEDIVTYAVTIGRGGPQIHYNIDSQEPNASHAQFYLELKDGHPDTLAALVSSLRRDFSGFTGAEIEIKELEQGPPVEAPVAIKILGDEMPVLQRIGQDVEEIFRSTPGTVNVDNPQGTSTIDLHVRINRAKAGMLGIPLVEIDRTIRAGISGLPISRFRDKEGKEYDIVVRLPIGEKPRVEDFDRITVTSMTGSPVPLNQVAALSFQSGPDQIEHYNFNRTVTITSDVDLGFATDQVNRTVIERLDRYNWPKGYGYLVSGEAEAREESFGGMGKAIIIALISIFAVLVLQFRSLIQPVIVFTAIPLAVIGSVLALLITGNTFSFTAFIGLTSLVGIVVNNSIILVDYTNQLRKENKPIIEALKEAGMVRFTPIVLTTATTIGGLLPLTLRGGTLYAPMGWTIIGGLTVSTFLTLFLVPVLYRLFNR
ncbi:MAG: efflux RND transporter permease subunit, partial [Candidatus Aminicenantes bacterium]|nr:efflux RND transporter permease subunit [Candidatus Aminicenantes bacterium]